MSNNINPRYIAYAKAVHNTTHEMALDKDRKRYPGGVMCGFVIWINHHVQQFGKIYPESVFASSCDGRYSIVDDGEFTKYLENIPYTPEEIKNS